MRVGKDLDELVEGERQAVAVDSAQGLEKLDETNVEVSGCRGHRDRVHPALRVEVALETSGGDVNSVGVGKIWRPDGIQLVGPLPVLVADVVCGKAEVLECRIEGNDGGSGVGVEFCLGGFRQRRRGRLPVDMVANCRYGMSGIVLLAHAVGVANCAAECRCGLDREEVEWVAGEPGQIADFGADGSEFAAKVGRRRCHGAEGDGLCR